MSDLPPSTDLSVNADPQLQARAAGYGWNEIDDHIAQASVAASNEGYSQDEIDQHLGYQDQSDFNHRATGSWTANSDDLVSGLSKPDPQIDLASPSMALDYRDALINREVKGPRDFSDSYAAAALGAAKPYLSTPYDDSHYTAAANASDALAASLPNDHDLTDAALSLSPDDPMGTKARLMNHWAETGQPPVDAAVQAANDPALEDKLTSPPAPTLDDLSKPGRDAIDKFYFVPGEEIPDAKSMHEALVDAGIDVATVAGLNLAGKYIVGPLARLAIKKAGEIPEWLGSLMDKTPTTVTDFTKPPGEATSTMMASEAFKPAEPAKIIAPEVTAPVEGEAAAEPKLPQIDPDASPSAKMETLAQSAMLPRDAVQTPEFQAKIGRLDDLRLMNEGITPDEFDRPNFFQNLYQQSVDKGIMAPDPAVEKLAQGHDTTASAMAYFKNLWQDETGSFSLFTTPDGKPVLRSEASRDKILGKNTADALIRRVANGRQVQETTNLANGFEQFYKDLSPYMPAFRAELEKGPAGNPMSTEIGQLLNALEGKGEIGNNSPFASYVRYRSLAHADNRARIDQMVQDEAMDPVQIRDWYISHMYTPESINGVRLSKGVTGGGRLGNLGFTRQRSIPTYEEAFAEGYMPLYDNPIQMDLAGIDAQKKVIDTLTMQKWARDNGWARYYQSRAEAARDGMEPINGIGSQKIASTVNEDGTPGRPVIQQLYAKTGFSDIWENWNAYDQANRNVKVARIEDFLLKIGNISTFTKLMLPLYHTVSIVRASTANAWADAMTEIGGGLKDSPEEMFRGIWDAAKAPIASVEYLLKGALTSRPMYRGMEMDPALQAFVDAGGNIATRGFEYKAGNTPTIWRDWQRGELMDRYTPKGEWKDLQLPFKALGQAATSLSAPFWDHGIPLVKAAASMKRIQTFLRQNPIANDALRNTRFRQIIDNADDRFGEYNMRNVFWPQVLKRAANLTMLSQGWTYGTVHAFLAAFGWRPGRGGEWNPIAVTSLAGQVATIAFTNALWSYAVDGKLPDNKLDYLIPFANARGIARVLLPGEEKEYYDWMKIAAESYSDYLDHGLGSATRKFSGDIGSYAEGKIKPLWQAAASWMMGEDKVGHKIGTAGYPVSQFLKDQFMPIFMNNADAAEKIGLNKVENAFGIREAPKWFEQWDAWRQGQQRYHAYDDRASIARARKEQGLGGIQTVRPTTNYGTPLRGNRPAYAPPRALPATNAYGTPIGGGRQRTAPATNAYGTPIQ